MACLECKNRFTMTRSEVYTYEFDAGDATDGEETGILNNGDTISSITVSFADTPSGATDPTAGSVSVGAATRWINGRQCAVSEWASFTITTSSSQAYGEYAMKLAVTTANSNVVNVYQRFTVTPEPGA